MRGVGADGRDSSDRAARMASEQVSGEREEIIDKYVSFSVDKSEANELLEIFS